MKFKKNELSKRGIFFAIASAFLYAFIVIIEKRYIEYSSSEMILFIMYLGAGIGLFFIHHYTKDIKTMSENKITKKEVPVIVCIVLCELLASFVTIEAVKVVNASLVSLLSVFEIVMTSICAYLIFKEPIKENEILSVILMVIGCFVLNYESGAFAHVSISSLLVILGCFFWGLENNLTAMISSKEPAFFTAIKCTSVSLMYFLIVLIKGSFDFTYPILLLFGFLTFGLSILSYALSTRYLGANKATIIFSFSPIFGVFLALFLYKESITLSFITSMILMISAIVCLNVKLEKK